MPLAKAGDLPRLLAGWTADNRLLLFAGPDRAASERLAATALARLGGEEPPELLPVTRLLAEPGALADAAASIPLFGGVRPVRIEGSAGELLPAIELLLAAPVAGNPVIAVTGDLRKTDPLHRLIAESRAAHLVTSYALDGRDLLRWIVETGRAQGLRLGVADAAELSSRVGTDQGVLAQELAKLALYRGAGPDATVSIDQEDVAAIAAGGGQEEASRLFLALLEGRGEAFDRELRLAERGHAIPVMRILARRLMQMLELARALEGGKSPEAAVAAARPPIFWKEKEAIARALPLWPSARVEAALAACLTAEAAIKDRASAGDVLAWQALAELAAGGPFPSRPALG